MPYNVDKIGWPDDLELNRAIAVLMRRGILKLVHVRNAKTKTLKEIADFEFAKEQILTDPEYIIPVRASAKFPGDTSAGKQVMIVLANPNVTGGEAIITWN